MLLVPLGLLTIIANQPQFVTLFIVLAVILAVLLSLVPLLNAEEQAQQHRELVKELAAIREDVSEIRQAVARHSQLIVDAIGHYDARSSQRSAGGSSSTKVSRTSILCLGASVTVIGVVLGRHFGRSGRKDG